MHIGQKIKQLRKNAGLTQMELAKRVGVSRTTLVEHLRKAENRIMGKLFVK